MYFTTPVLVVSITAANGATNHGASLPGSWFSEKYPLVDTLIKQRQIAQVIYTHIIHIRIPPRQINGRIVSRVDSILVCTISH